MKAASDQGRNDVALASYLAALPLATLLGLLLVLLASFGFAAPAVALAAFAFIPPSPVLSIALVVRARLNPLSRRQRVLTAIVTAVDVAWMAALVFIASLESAWWGLAAAGGLAAATAVAVGRARRAGGGLRTHELVVAAAALAVAVVWSSRRALEGSPVAFVFALALTGAFAATTAVTSLKRLRRTH